MDIQKKYPAKLLLFGEYAILDGGQALAIPYDKYFGHWDFLAKEEQPVFDLIPFVKYLKTRDLSDKLDLQAFAKDVNNGLLFRSSIPMGYGAGSSGALCAAVWDRYGEKEMSIERLKTYFINMESFFHGNSSGIDPLVSFLNKPILTGKLSPSEHSKPTIKVIEPIAFPKQITVFDSMISRSTAPLVAWYKNKMIKDSLFKRAVLAHLIPANSKAIDALLDEDEVALQNAFEEISHWQFEFFDTLIPDKVKVVWREAWSRKNNYKICGAGGGGFFLVYRN